MNNKELAHAWAHALKQSGTGSHFYYEGDTIYSYGPHFPIARRIECNGVKAVLFTTHDYSMSTSRHISYTRMAIPHRNVFHVDDVRAKPVSSVVKSQYRARLDTVISNTKRARNLAPHLETAKRIIDEANACAGFFGWKWTFDALPKALIEKAKADEAKNAERIKKGEAEFRKIDALVLPYWRKHQDTPPELRKQYQTLLKYLPNNRGANLRLSVDRQTIETSLGAKVPADQAQDIWDAIRITMRSKAAAVPANGQRLPIGDFYVDRIDPNGDLKAGCHFIHYAESEYIAKELNL